MLRQPVHTLYGGAHLFKAGTARAMGALALKSLSGYGPEALGVSQTVYDRVVAKLRNEPVEDYRVDFEDGYGYRPVDEEARDAKRTALEMAKGLEGNALPPFIGVRIKPNLQPLDLFLETLLPATNGKLPPNFVVTLPKVSRPSQVEALVKRLEPVANIPIELMLETTEGLSSLTALVDAAQGRCRGVHFGAYDYLSECEISADNQDLAHPACDFARSMMQAALAGRGLMLSDGAFNILPLPPADVPRAWQEHQSRILRALRSGFYQGWDLHPAQLPSRYGAVYTFFLAGLEKNAERLKNFLDNAARATRVGQVFDDAATGRGLVNFFLRGTLCGALTSEELGAAGLPQDLNLPAFAASLKPT